MDGTLSAPMAIGEQFDCFLREARTYNQDGLITMHDCSFIDDARFAAAYREAQATGSWTGPWGQAGIHSPRHTLCWAGQTVNHLRGDYVECGVDRGGTAMLLLKYLRLDEQTSHRLYLYDTFCGLDPTRSSEVELIQYAGIYRECFEEVRARFAAYGNVIIRKGSIPDSLVDDAPEQVAFLHIDMNAAQPERAAIEFFWERLVPGAIVVLDDYAWVACHAQKVSMDEFARSVGCAVLSLPTGQGMFMKSAAA